MKPEGSIRFRADLRPSLVCLLLVLSLVTVSGATAEEEMRLQCKPRVVQVVPGEPIRLELTVAADSTDPIRLQVPRHPLLKLRALEKSPVQRTKGGAIVHKRVIVWQGLEPGKTKITSLSIETKEKKLFFPEVTITVRDPGP